MSINHLTDLYELACELWRQSGCLPVQLFVLGRQAPQLPSPLPPIHALSDKEFFTELQRCYGGINLWQKVELRELLLPLLRADLILVETYAHTPTLPLPCAPAAFVGESGGFRGLAHPGIE